MSPAEGRCVQALAASSDVTLPTRHIAGVVLSSCMSILQLDVPFK